MERLGHCGPDNQRLKCGVRKKQPEHGEGKQRKGRLSVGLHPRRILALIDFKDGSKEVLDCALQYAEMHGASVHFMHVIERLSFLSGMESVPLALSENQMAEEAKVDLLEFMEKGDGGLEAKPLVRAGKLELEVKAAALELRADLIIMSGDRGSSSINPWGRGTVEKVIQHAGCPVLVLQND